LVGSFDEGAVAAFWKARATGKKFNELFEGNVSVMFVCLTADKSLAFSDGTTAQNPGFFMVPGSGAICLAQWEVQNSWSQIGVIESLDDARAFGVVFGDIFKGEYKLKRMGRLHLRF
jgi:hypothetical protein